MSSPASLSNARRAKVLLLGGGRFSKRVATTRNVWFFVLLVVAIAWFWPPLAEVASLSLQHGAYPHHSHIVLIPFMSMFLLYMSRREIFENVEWSPGFGVFLMAMGIAMVWLRKAVAPDAQVSLSLTMLSMITVCLGIFVLCYGMQAFRKGSFGLLLLLFMIPIPSLVLDGIIRFLQQGSADATWLLFDLLAVPVFREGFVFRLPRITIEVAEECSGIRSSLALLICSLIAGHLFLHSAWPKLILVLFVVPLTIVKNAIRIVVLSLLGSYVDPSFVTDSLLHSKGGIPFFIASLAVMGLIVSILVRVERTR